MSIAVVHAAGRPHGRAVILLPLAQTGRELNSDVDYSQGFRAALPLVGTVGIEPTTPRLSSVCSTAELCAKKLLLSHNSVRWDLVIHYAQGTDLDAALISR